MFNILYVIPLNLKFYPELIQLEYSFFPIAEVNILTNHHYCMVTSLSTST